MSEDRIRRPQSPKEIDVFNRHSNLNKLKIIAIGIIIAVVSITVLYFFTKSLLTYTVTYHTDGGTVYGEELEASQYRFLQKTKEPKNLKKEGYYIAGYYTDAKLTNEYKFGKSFVFSGGQRLAVARQMEDSCANVFSCGTGLFLGKAHTCGLRTAVDTRGNMV